MQPRDVFVLEIIIDYCKKIQCLLQEYKIDEESFLEKPFYQDTCAFYCLQIGENVNNLSDQFKTINPAIPWHKISGLRNLVAHEYGNIEPEILWKTIHNDIPTLLDYCSKQIGL